MKKLIFIAFLSFLVNACNKSNEKELKFWHFWSEPNQSKIIRELVSEFEKQNHCKVQLTELSWNDGKTKLIAAFNSNTSPDLLELGSDWIAQFSSSNILEQLYPNEFNFEKFYKFALQPTSYKSQFYAVPWIVDTRVLFYNIDLMEKYGIKTPPKTFDDLLEYSSKINELSGYYGFGANGSDPHRLYKKIIPLIWSFGGSIVDSNGNIKLNTKEARLAFSYYYQLSRSGIIETQKQIDLLFAKGKVGFCFSGSWLFKMIDEINPNLRFSTTLIPNTPYSHGISFAGGEYLAISKTSTKKELAKKLIKFLISKNAVLKLCISIKEAGFPADSTIDIQNLLQKDQNKIVFAEQLKYSKMTPNHPKWLEIEPLIEEALVEVLYQKKGVEQALIDLQKKVEVYNKQIYF